MSAGPVRSHEGAPASFRAAWLLLTEPPELFQRLRDDVRPTRPVGFAVACVVLAIAVRMTAVLARSSPQPAVAWDAALPLVFALPGVFVGSVVIHAVAKLARGHGTLAHSLWISCYATFPIIFRAVDAPIFRGLAIGYGIVIIANGIAVLHGVKRWHAYLVVILVVTAGAFAWMAFQRG